MTFAPPASASTVITCHMSAVAHMFSTLVFYLTCGNGSFYPANGVISMLTLDARTSYPWPLCWGNALWGCVAFRLYRETIKPQKPRASGLVYTFLVSFAFYVMAGNICTNLLFLGRTPTALTSKFILPVHFLAFVFVEMCPAVFEVLLCRFWSFQELI